MTLYPKDRIAALTDGIFAVAMTLLVLDLRVPEGKGTGQLAAHLQVLVGRFDDYIISFVVLCVFWLSHHRLLSRLRGVDPTFLWLNFLFVLFITFVPAVTALVGDYPHAPLAALIYGADVGVVLGMEFLLWRHGTAKLYAGGAQAAAAIWRGMRARFAIALAATVAAVLIAMAEIEAGIGVTYSSYVYLILLVTILFRAHDHRGDSGETEGPGGDEAG
jgi:uncharacterized membrane protein